MLPSAWVLCAVLYASRTLAGMIAPRNTSSVKPISIDPSGDWDGIDGSWSSFNLEVGTSAQTVRVFPSWLSYQTWVVLPQGCPSASDYSSCASSRGGLFNTSQSSTWDFIGLYSLYIEENLDYDGNADFGYDVVTVGGTGQGGPTLKNSTVGAFAVTDFWLGLFGLNPKPTNWTSYNDPAPSYMTQLKEQGLIPSISFGYTAGALYQNSGVLGSLVLGGYDASRFVSNDIEFAFSSNDQRDTVVAIQSITTTSQNTSATASLLPTPIEILIDSTVPHIWLPTEACTAFEQEFGLIHDSATDLYLVNSTLHSTLLARNPNITFTLAAATTGGSTIAITLPYSAFNLTAQGPYQGLATATTYFPLRRAANSTQYTLGRTFMQEAYISVDYERAKFNVSQCSFSQDAANIVTIEPSDASTNSGYSGAGIATSTTSSSSSASSKGLSGGAIAGIVIGALLAGALIAGLIIWLLLRKRRNDRVVEKTSEKSKHTSYGSSAGMAPSSMGDTLFSSGAAVSSDDRPASSNIGAESIIGSTTSGTYVYPKAELEGSRPIPEELEPTSSRQQSPVRGLLLPSCTTNSTPDPSSPSQADVTSTHSSSDNTNSTWPLVSPLAPTETSFIWPHEAGGNQLYEMPADSPAVPQADSRPISEKDIMRRREQEYNGVNPQSRQGIGQAPPQAWTVGQTRFLPMFSDGAGRSTRPYTRFFYEDHAAESSSSSGPER